MAQNDEILKISSQASDEVTAQALPGTLLVPHQQQSSFAATSMAALIEICCSSKRLRQKLKMQRINENNCYAQEVITVVRKLVLSQIETTVSTMNYQFDQ